MNAQDYDLDGDGKDNIVDTDIDNDGEDNSLDFYKQTFEMKKSVYDYTDGGVIEIPLRLLRAYANVGIFMGAEMARDYEIDPSGYIGDVNSNEFTDYVANWQNWLDHNSKLLKANEHLNEFDILFFQSGHVGLLTRSESGEDLVLEADSTHFYVKAREGELTVIGRLLPKPKNKRY